MSQAAFQLVTLKISVVVPSRVAKQQSLQYSGSHDGQLPYFKVKFSFGLTQSISYFIIIATGHVIEKL